MAFGHQFRNGTLVERACDQQNDVINHVAVSDEVQESGSVSYGMITHMLELRHQFFFQIVINLADLEWAGDVSQEITVVSALQM